MRTYLTILALLLISVPSFCQQQRDIQPEKPIKGAVYEHVGFCKEPLPKSEFETYYRELNGIFEHSVRFDRIRREIGNYCLSTLQVYKLLQLFDKPLYRYDLLKLCFYYVIDAENYKRLVPQIQNPEYEEEMNEFLALRMKEFTTKASQIQEMTVDELAEAKQSLRSHNGELVRLVVAKEIIQSNPMRSQQVSALLNEFGLGKNQAELAKFSYKYVLDPENYYLIIEGFRNRKFGEEVDAYIKANPKRVEEHLYERKTCRYPTPPSDFSFHKQSLKNKQFDSDRLTLAKKLLADNCYRVNQVIEIMEMFKKEEDKLKIAEAAFDKTHDLVNFYLVNEQFMSQASIEKLYTFLQEKL